MVAKKNSERRASFWQRPNQTAAMNRLKQEFNLPADDILGSLCTMLMTQDDDEATATYGLLKKAINHEDDTLETKHSIAEILYPVLVDVADNEDLLWCDCQRHALNNLKRLLDHVSPELEIEMADTLNPRFIMFLLAKKPKNEKCVTQTVAVLMSMSMQTVLNRMGLRERLDEDQAYQVLNVIRDCEQGLINCTKKEGITGFMAALCVAYLVGGKDDAKRQGAVSSNNVVSTLLQGLEVTLKGEPFMGAPWKVWELLLGVLQISFNDKSKIGLAKARVLPYLVQVLEKNQKYANVENSFEGLDRIGTELEIIFALVGT